MHSPKTMNLLAFEGGLGKPKIRLGMTRIRAKAAPPLALAPLQAPLPSHHYLAERGACPQAHSGVGPNLSRFAGLECNNIRISNVSNHRRH